MDRDKAFERLAGVRTADFPGRDEVMYDYLMVARAAQERQAAEVEMTATFAKEHLKKKDFSMKKRDVRTRFTTPGNRDRWLREKQMELNRERHQIASHQSRMYKRVRDRSYKLMFSFLARYRAHRVIMHYGDSAPRHAIMKPVPHMLSTGREQIRSLSFSPYHATFREQVNHAIDDAADLVPTKVPLFSNSDPYLPPGTFGLHMGTETIRFKLVDGGADVQVRIPLLPMGIRLYFRVNIALVMRSEEARGLPRELWKLIVNFVLSPPALVTLDAKNTIYLPGPKT